MPGQYFGKYTGIVKDNKDDDKLGQLKVVVPAIFPEDEQMIARPALPYGFFFVPDDVLHNASINDVIRYVPKSHAIMRHPDRSRSLVTINEDGWNSTKPASMCSAARFPWGTRSALPARGLWPR